METHSKSEVVHADFREERERGSLRKSLHISSTRKAALPERVGLICTYLVWLMSFYLTVCLRGRERSCIDKPEHHSQTNSTDESGCKCVYVFIVTESLCNV